MMKKILALFGLFALLGVGAVMASSGNLERLIDAKLDHLQTLEDKIGQEEGVLEPEFQRDCQKNIKRQILTYEREKKNLEATNLKKLRSIAEKNETPNQECIDKALAKRLEMIQQKQERLKGKTFWRRWLGL
jgi:iron-sulfur cluster repair protein YtfE (RIC family)